MTEQSIAISVPEDEDSVTLTFESVGDENQQHLLAHYLHPKLLSIKQNIPDCDIKVRITETSDLYVHFVNLGDYANRQKFEKFLYIWLPKALKDLE